MQAKMGRTAFVFDGLQGQFEPVQVFDKLGLPRLSVLVLPPELPHPLPRLPPSQQLVRVPPQRVFFQALLFGFRDGMGVERGQVADGGFGEVVDDRQEDASVCAPSVT